MGGSGGYTTGSAVRPPFAGPVSNGPDGPGRVVGRSTKLHFEM
jgi:hypothetical protein